MAPTKRFALDSEETQDFLSMENQLADLALAMRNPDRPPRKTVEVASENGRVFNIKPALPAVIQEEEYQPTSFRKQGRPLLGDKPKVEKSFSMQKELYKQLTYLSNLEGLRHDTKISVSAIMEYLLLYALSHVKDNKVIPGPDGYGLIIGGAEESGEQ